MSPPPHFSSPLLSFSLVSLRSFTLPPRHAPLYFHLDISGPLPVLAVVVPSSLMSPGIRDLRLARSPVSPLIHSQVAPCTVNDLDRLTHNPESVIMGSQGDSGICRRLNLRLCRRPKHGKPFFPYEFRKSGTPDRLHLRVSRAC